jgi:hypothetical protein
VEFSIHLKPEVETLRFYKVGDSYARRSSPILSATIHYISDHEAYICNTVGKLNRKLLRQLIKTLNDKGILYLRYERKERMKTIKIKKFLEQ